MTTSNKKEGPVFIFLYLVTKCRSEVGLMFFTCCVEFNLKRMSEGFWKCSGGPGSSGLPYSGLPGWCLLESSIYQMWAILKNKIKCEPYITCAHWHVYCSKSLWSSSWQILKWVHDHVVVYNLAQSTRPSWNFASMIFVVLVGVEYKWPSILILCWPLIYSGR
jgi:hypothetical protein